MADMDLRPGLVISSGDDLVVNVDGARFTTPWWPNWYSPAAGDAVRVLIAHGEATVLGPAVAAPRPITGTVTDSASGGTIPVEGSDGEDYECRYLGTAPSVSDEVMISWQATQPWVVGVGASYTEPDGETEDGGPDGTGDTNSGTLLIPAVDAGTYHVNWSNNDVRQGTYGSYTYYGAWFYGSKPRQLKGATITSARIRLGARTARGDYDSSLDINLQRTASKTKPSGAVTLTGTTDVLTVGTYPTAAHWVSLDATIAQALVDAGGGGLGISGSPYGGVVGLADDPASGQLELKWTR